MAEEQKEEKLKFLRREDIRTMQKDLKSLRENAAQTERERIASLEIEKSGGKIITPSPSTPLPTSDPQTVTEDIIPKKIYRPSQAKKYLVRIAIILIFLSIAGFLVIKIINKNNQEEIPEAINPEEIVEKIPEIKEPEKVELPIEELIKNNLISWGYKVPSEPRDIDTIIIHSGYSTSEDSYDIFTILEKYKNYKVAPHYFINREGVIYLLIPNEYIAHHAGSGAMPDGSRKNIINDFSIGIELIYKIDESPNENQYKSLALLVNYLQKEYPINQENILGRNEISPEQTDPWNFSWETLDFYTQQLSL
ncbi:MAG: peptidoglycan recognition family protein [Patescibacteria group bacterium]